MNQQSNTFVRGYQRLSVRRDVLITYEEDCGPAYRPLHASQANLSDDQLHMRSCVFCDDFALVEDGQTLPPDLDAQCIDSGVIHAVLYAIEGKEAGAPIEVGDTYSSEAVREVVRRLTFETGHYSRCWEISSAHLTEDAQQYLERLVDTDTSTSLFFEAFRIPNSSVVGVKLIATPWTDTHLQSVDGCSAADLRGQQQRVGVPTSLVEVLHLAALADARFVVFDPDAPVLEGLELQGN